MMSPSIIIILSLIINNALGRDPATLDPTVLANIKFDQVEEDIGIGWVKVLSCTESMDASTFSYPLSGGATKMAELQEYAICIKFVPEDGTENYAVENIIVGSDDYAVQAKTCSNPVITLNNGYEVSFTVDYDNNESVSFANLDNWLGSQTAKARLSTACTRNLRSMQEWQYHACNNPDGLHVNDGSDQFNSGDRCVWDHADPTAGKSIAIYYGFDMNRQSVCAETNGDGQVVNLVIEECENLCDAGIAALNTRIDNLVVTSTISGSTPPGLLFDFKDLCMIGLIVINMIFSVILFWVVCYGKERDDQYKMVKVYVPEDEDSKPINKL